LEQGIWGYDTFNFRDYGVLPHKQVDDAPYGGGSGMVMRADVVDKALLACGEGDRRPLLVMSARGRRLEQKDIESWSSGEGLRIVCGRFEGIDQRVVEKWEGHEISVSDVVLAGGEVASMLVVEACVRLLDGVLGDPRSLEEESYGSGGLLEHPHYTRPRMWEDRGVPEVLLSGDHGKIGEWRRKKSEEVTLLRREDLWREYNESLDRK
jgi:tRNA (guanine37-N1)-methyltransferase